MNKNSQRSAINLVLLVFCVCVCVYIHACVSIRFLLFTSSFGMNDSKYKDTTFNLHTRLLLFFFSIFPSINTDFYYKNTETRNTHTYSVWPITGPDGTRGVPDNLQCVCVCACLCMCLCVFVSVCVSVSVCSCLRLSTKSAFY